MEGEASEIISGGSRMPTEKNAHRWLNYVLGEWKKDKNQVMVAEENGTAVGFIFFVSKAEVVMETKYDWAFINNLYVRSENRRRGIASTLMTTAFTYLKSLGIQYVRAGIIVDNDASFELFKKFGFREFARILEARLL
jgi:ribosomal protein S18 acetylase RimI-like enzyme